MKRVLILSTFLVLLSFTQAIAQAGPYVGAGLVYLKPLGDIKDIDPGVGFNLKFGYDFGPVALEGNFLNSNHSDKLQGFGNADFTGFTIDLRIFVSPVADPNQVYLLVGVGSYSIDQVIPIQTNQGIQSVNTTMDGSGWDFGGGLEHYFNPNLALNLAAIYRVIRYDQIESGGITFSQPTLKGDTWSIQAGINYYF